VSVSLSVTYRYRVHVTDCIAKIHLLPGNTIILFFLAINIVVKFQQVHPQLGTKADGMLMKFGSRYILARIQEVCACNFDVIC